MRNQWLGLGVVLSLAVSAVAQTTAPAAGVEAREFGLMPDGTPVRQFILTNAHGMVLKVMEEGAAITELRLPTKEGQGVNVVMGADSFEAYKRHPRAALVIGRVANRIAGAKFTLDGTEYHLNANNGPNTIHGGREGFGRKLWTGKVLAGKNAVELVYASKDGEEGFPGNLVAKVTYTLTDDDAVRLEYAATTDKPTLVNLTSHAYFNLGGVGSGDILGHEVWVDADKYTVADEQLIPTGEIAPVKGTPLDFTEPATIGSRIGQLPGRNGTTTYDHNYVLNSGGKKLALVARVREPKSGRVMEVETDQPGVQLYTSDQRHEGLCLETQHFPDAVHHPEFPSTVLRPGERFESTTVYRFKLP